jgi:hypothetical protein
MENRSDHNTAADIELAIDIRQSRGELAAARFLQKCNVPIEVAVRVISKNFGRYRERI